MTTSTDTCLAALASRLTHVRASERADTLAEVRGLIDEADRPDSAIRDLGDPARLAQQLLADREPDPARPQGELAGVPLDLRGPSTDLLRARLFGPADPRLFTPHLFGLGWSVNLGAVAVRLGLLRPDDVDEQVEAAIPAATIAVARLTPLALATALTVLARLGCEPEASAGTDGGALGGVDAWAGEALPWVAAGLAARNSGPGRPAVDRLVWPAAATALVLASGAGLAQRRGASPAAQAALALAAPTAAFGMLVVPVRQGLRRHWAAARHAG